MGPHLHASRRRCSADRDGSHRKDDTVRRRHRPSRYYGPSYTYRDLSVYSTKADVLFTGDTWWNGLYPFIDYVAGGSIDGMITAANANIGMVSEHPGRAGSRAGRRSRRPGGI